MTPKCSSVFGHNFEPRYDEEPGLSVEMGPKWRREDVLAIFDATRKRTYVHDVCTRCGATVNRDESGA